MKSPKAFWISLFALLLCLSIVADLVQSPPAEVEEPEVAGVLSVPEIIEAPIMQEPVVYSHEEILDALWQVESSGMKNPPNGDDGQAIGPFQIHWGYWNDAAEYSRSHSDELSLAHGKGNYDMCSEVAYAALTVQMYMLRYCPDAWEARDAETIARIHNGGPKGATKKSTEGYWLKVKAQLETKRG